MTSPTLAYDREANALYIRFTDHKVMGTVELSETVYVDMYTDGKPVVRDPACRAVTALEHPGASGHRLVA